MSLSIPITLTPDFPRVHKPGGDLSIVPEEQNTRLKRSPDGKSQSRQPSLRFQASDITSSSRTSSVTISLTARVSLRKSSSSSLAIFTRPPPLAPPAVHWCALPDSPVSSSSTLVEFPQEESANANVATDRNLRSHLQTYLDENKLANRSLTMDNAISYCAALKGFQEHSSFQLDGSFQQLLTHATMLDFVLEESNHEGLSHILQGLDKGIEEFLESLEELPFTLRNTQSFISTTSDILWAKSALLGVAGQLTPGADNMTLKRVMKRCQHERDMLLRAIRVFFDIADFESRLQTKLSIKETSNTAPSPKRKIRFRPSTLTRRQSNAAQQSKPRDAPPIIASIPSQPQSKGKEEEDEYNFHVAIVSDVVTPLEWDQYWGVSMPDPVGEAADVLFSEESGSMQGASLIALVYILTDPQPRTPIGDDDLLDTFLLCFRGFCDPVELAKALLSRYEEQPGDLNDSQREAWPAYQSSIKARVLGLINTWVDQYWVHEKDCIAGLHLKDFVSLIDEEFAIDERAEIVRKLNERREEAVSPAASGDSVDQSQSDLNPKSSSRVACRQTPIQYRGRLQVRVQKFIRKVTQPTPTDVELQSAKALDDLICSNDGNIHILDLNSREFCQDLARQLALFMSEGYLRVMPEDLWYRFGLGHGCDSDTARIAQQTYESALSSWVTGSILDQVEAETRAAVMTFFIALALRSHEYHNYSAMRSIYEGLTHPCLASLSDMHLPLDVPTSWALDRLSELRENIDGIAITGRGVSLFPQPAVPAMEWYLNAFGNTINAKPHLMSPNSQRPIANMGRCFNVVRIIREMEHWHVPYNYPRADHVQAWLLKSLEGAIARDADKQCDWMFRQSEVIEKTGRPESAKQKLPRLSNPFGRRNSKTTEWKVATIWELIPKLGPTAKPATTLPQKGSRSESALSLFSKPLPPLPLA